MSNTEYLKHERNILGSIAATVANPNDLTGFQLNAASDFSLLKNHLDAVNQGKVADTNVYAFAKALNTDAFIQRVRDLPLHQREGLVGRLERLYERAAKKYFVDQVELTKDSLENMQVTFSMPNYNVGTREMKLGMSWNNAFTYVKDGEGYQITENMATIDKWVKDNAPEAKREPGNPTQEEVNARLRQDVLMTLSMALPRERRTGVMAFFNESTSALAKLHGTSQETEAKRILGGIK